MDNWTLADEVRDYWSARAQTFDDQAGHRISGNVEMKAWQALFGTGLGRMRLDGLHILDLACGTGEISRAVLDMGGRVTAVDFAEPMLERARAKHLGREWQGIQADAQILAPLADETFDGAVTRHLVWTLTDPRAAFTQWLRVLKPGGKLVIADGNWVSESWHAKLLRNLAARLASDDFNHGKDMERHRRILEQLPYGDGLTFKRLAADLAAAGFINIRALPLRRVYVFGMRQLKLAEWLRLNAGHRFALVAERP